ncbi:S1 RNA-binding domain-containing protein [Bradymonas sediminis]|uniref:30S ribosomal protein S1 n=1 Tax=Bradymonas sediminis TaxID=1548548 RepID=A0A2Z4FH26_9DELT|nr:S1 RNA-binding domain-containing protein [Bradymonas sediminis]AWV88277.1 30S ribosomal protein S1 [Bradymonas sediminis]TDP77399.1 small subunit ribosomal protein S1 [Bradymonas sediminis]
MSDKESKNQDVKTSETDDTKPRTRKRVQLVDEPAGQKPAAASKDAQSSESDTVKADGAFKTEHSAGGKVRVARAVEKPDLTPLPKSEKPAKKAKKGDKRSPRPQDETRAAKSAPRSAPKAPKSDRTSTSHPPKDIQINTPALPDVTTADFEALLMGEGAAASAPVNSYVSPGDKVDATIVAIGEDFVFVSFSNSKTEGMVKIDDVRDEEGNVAVEVGDPLELFVLSTKGGEIRMGKKLSGRDGAMEAIYTAHATGMPIEGRVAETNKGGFEIAIGGVRAFCPVSQIELGYTDNPEIHLNNTYRFRVEKIAEEGRNIVVSRTALLEEERAERRKETLERLKVDEIVSGKVTRVLDFGAFVDIGGIEGMVHISELSYGAVDKTSDVVSEGDTVQVKILNIEEQKRGDLRIGLSIKATQDDPWERVNEQFAIGSQVEGVVVRLAPFGAFVEIAPGIDGLVHVSEMSWKQHIKHPSDVLSNGQKIRVEIQDIDLTRQRISLSMKAVENDPWDGAENRYTVGMEVSGEVENVQDFGAFVRLESGITALIPRSEMDLPGGSTPQRKYTTGTTATARVLNVDPVARKMALTEKAAGDIQASSDAPARRKSKSDAPSEPSGGPRNFVDQKSESLGTFADLLKKNFGKD